IACSCNTHSNKAEKQIAPIQISTAPVHNLVSENEICPDDNKSLEDMSLEDLSVLNRNLTKKLRNDYRFWSSNEPERWPTLAENFADNIICSCPEASSQKNEIAQFYLTYLEKRTKVVNSDVKNKQALMSQ